jgi:hypothetical protein
MTHITIERAKLEKVFYALTAAKHGNLDNEWTEEVLAICKQALAAPVQSCYCPNCEAMGKELAALKAHLTEAKKVELATNWFPEDWAITKAVGMLHDYDRLLRKTTPPAAQRTWTGLTDEERGKVYADWRWSDGRTSNLALCEAIEAKLKELNT